MNIITKSKSAKKPKTGESQKAAYAYVSILVVLVLAQLFTFDKFVVLIESFGLPGGVPVARFVSCIIVSIEVLSLPFLLRIKLSPLMRVVSMIFGWLVPLIWFKLSLWLLFTINAVPNIGFLGTITDLTPGWWAVFVSIAIGILAAWASWGLWPFPLSDKSK